MDFALEADVLSALAPSEVSADVSPEPERPPEPTVLTGRSFAIRRLNRALPQAALSNLTVLIEGEPGTGKTLFARALHESSERALAPLIILDAVKEGGDLTFALRRAAGSTLLIEDVQALTPESQGLLLEYLVSRGSADDEPRILATTRVDLVSLAANRQFRPELVELLREISFRIPPLRQRREDIAPLALHLVRTIAAKDRGVVTRLSPAALDAMESRPWLGNVAELESVVRAAVWNASGGVITVAGIPSASREVDPSAWQTTFAPHARAALGQPSAYHKLLQSAERVILQEAMTLSGGNKVRASALLGIHRNSLARRLRHLGSQTGSFPLAAANHLR